MDLELNWSPVMQCLSTALGYLVVFSLVYITIILISLIVRFLHFKFGKRLEPNGNKAIIITGATSGLGLAVAKVMYLRGFTIFACYYNEKEQGYSELLKLAQSRQDQQNGKVLSNGSPKAHLFLTRMDVRSEESIASSGVEINKLIDEHKLKLHCLLNNAGITINTAFQWSDRESIRMMMETNLSGVMLVTRQFILKIIQDKGRVINVSSGLKYFHHKTFLMYGTTKSAVAYFSVALNDELKRYGAMCCCLFPGNFSTNTNIAYLQFKQFMKTRKNLDPQESLTYRKSINQYSKFLNIGIGRIIKQNNHSLEQISSIYNIDLADLEALERKGGLKDQSWIIRFMLPLATLLGGGSNNPNLEQSGIMDGFEYALCALDPVSTIFVGNFFYTHFEGPALSLLPQSIRDFLFDRLWDAIS